MVGTHLLQTTPWEPAHDRSNLATAVILTRTERFLYLILDHSALRITLTFPCCPSRQGANVFWISLLFRILHQREDKDATPWATGFPVLYYLPEFAQTHVH